jgi:hypothetical protein
MGTIPGVFPQLAALTTATDRASEEVIAATAIVEAAAKVYAPHAQALEAKLQGLHRLYAERVVHAHNAPFFFPTSDQPMLELPYRGNVVRHLRAHSFYLDFADGRLALWVRGPDRFTRQWAILSISPTEFGGVAVQDPRIAEHLTQVIKRILEALAEHGARFATAVQKLDALPPR